MASNVSRAHFRSKAAASPTTFKNDGGSVDDTQKRLGAIEAILAEIKAILTTLATKTEVEQVRGSLGKIEAVLPHLATKADVAEMKADIATNKTEIANLYVSIIKWVVGTLIAGIAAAYSVARFIR